MGAFKMVFFSLFKKNITNYQWTFLSFIYLYVMDIKYIYDLDSWYTFQKQTAILKYLSYVFYVKKTPLCY